MGVADVPPWARKVTSVADYWEPTMNLRWVGESGQLQQQWTREVREWKTYGGKELLTRRTETEWRDIQRVPSAVTQP